MLPGPGVVVIANVGDVPPMAGRIELEEVAEQRRPLGGFGPAMIARMFPLPSAERPSTPTNSPSAPSEGSPVMTSRTRGSEVQAFRISVILPVAPPDPACAT